MLIFARKTLFTLFVSLVSLYCYSVGYAQSEEKIAGQLPLDWFVLPENSQAFSLANPDENNETRTGAFSGIRERFRIHKKRGLEATVKSFDRILSASGESLNETANFIGSRKRPENAPKDWVPWHLHELFLALGVSAQGTLGVIGGGVAPSAEIYWRRPPPANRSLGLIPESSQRRSFSPRSQGDLFISDSTTSTELDQKIIPLVNGVMASGKVKNPESVRAGLKKAAKELQDLLADVNYYNNSSWEVSQFNLQVTISGAGVVHYGITVGGAVILNLYWNKEATSYLTPPVYISDFVSSKRESMRITMANLGQDLESITHDLYSSSGFKIHYIKVGIGMFFGVNIGMGRGEGSAIGAVTFTKAAQKSFIPRVLASELAEQDLPFISEANANHLAYAKAHAVNFSEEKNTGSGASTKEKVIYYLNRPRFRAGLKKAAKIGAFFAERSAKASFGNWYVDEVRPQFALSLMGNIGVASVGGIVVLEMAFKRVRP